ncbi:MAG: tRNA (adenosine(37)-N6)-threonylcarbamoyltransferase complex ATPase subunit type 1 TsaE [Candidatus Omnitrophica bacterium]|nr:tRNA (adenosine(37)-N6)-threonylcarbamoyltransferase complex ATPase subunit type 1 TsaE [Candidatus Omnitrophota bacterium]
MKTVSLLSKSESETLRFGERLAKHLRKGDILCLEGELGSGKTTLIKGIAKGLKIASERVNSPTFVLMNAYHGRLPVPRSGTYSAGQAGLPLYHFDLYRLEKADEIGAIGYEEFLYGDGVAVIEWAERLGALTPKEYLRVELKHKGENERSIKLAAVGEKYCRITRGLVNGK